MPTQDVEDTALIAYLSQDIRRPVPLDLLSKASGSACAGAIRGRLANLARFDLRTSAVIAEEMTHLIMHATEHDDLRADLRIRLKQLSTSGVQPLPIRGKVALLTDAVVDWGLSTKTPERASGSWTLPVGLTLAAILFTAAIWGFA